MTTTETIADIIIARGVNTTYSYTIPDELIDQITVGTPVMVPLGPRHQCAGTVTELTSNPTIPEQKMDRSH